VLDWPIGPVLVGAVGLVIIGAGCYLVWQALRGAPQDEKAVLDAAPWETPALHRLGAIGNIAGPTPPDVAAHIGMSGAAPGLIAWPWP
jgi:hypothetical protein